MFDHLLDSLAPYQSIRDALKTKKYASVSGLSGAGKAHLLYTLLQNNQQASCLIIAPHDQAATQLYRDLSFFCSQPVFLFPEREYIFYDLDTTSNEVHISRMQILERLRKQSSIVITTIGAILKPVLPPQQFDAFFLTLEEGMEVQFDTLTEQLVLAGYTRSETVEGRGQFSVRGGLMDIYPFTDDRPYRLELFGDEIDTIRAFDPFTQLSVEQIGKLTLTPAREIIYTPQQAEAVSLQLEQAPDCSEIILSDVEKLRNLHYFPSNEKYLPLFYPTPALLLDYMTEDTLVFLDEPTALKEKAENTLWQLSEDITGMIERGALCSLEQTYCVEYETLQQRLRSFFVLEVSALEKADIHLPMKSQSTYQGNTALLLEDLNYYHRLSYTVIIPAGGRSRAAMLTDSLQKDNLPVRFVEDHQQKAEGITVTTGSLSSGFVYPDLKLIIISDRDIFKQKESTKRRRANKQERALGSVSELNIGDYVVHVNHGIGQYVGQELVTAGNVTKDYLKLQYGGTDVLYIPATQLDQLHKYIGSKSEVKLNKLGGKEWQNTKSRVRASCAELADNLIQLYAARQQLKGHAFAVDSPWQQEFEETFPYEETPDQLRSIEEVKKDMERPLPMDRLLCGDVGYGKTEVAIRAAFKCVMDGKQVAYLAPTTILASQHYQTFRQRMESFAVEVEMLSRFRTTKEQKETLSRLQAGKIDILIGTHRLLQKDVVFRDLGLLIVDEEQRFGVAHKERMKELKQDVDVLTMTATPIPRTLHMSMIGIRDISVIETPPQDRYPVRTYVLEYNPSIIADAISRELARGGQVYYLSNRVENMEAIVRRIAQLVPTARIAFAHGKMREQQLEHIMLDMQQGEIDVLVCTTIIETGLDIPNVNTILIEDADRLGLSQLYQLRGRVGRSDRMAYAYLMYHRDKALSEIAQKRLIALRDFTEFGSGFRIALRDLEIRGAGNILGSEQHGHMDSVGYELFCSMLEEEVNRRKGIEVNKPEVQIDLTIDAYIPKDYIRSEEHRLDIYRRIAGVSSQSMYSDMCDELCDRFGDIPASVVNLLEVALLKSMAGSLGIYEIKQTGNHLNFFSHSTTAEWMAHSSILAQERKGEILLSAGNKPCLTLRQGAAKNHGDTLTNIKIILQRLFQLQFPEK